MRTTPGLRSLLGGFVTLALGTALLTLAAKDALAIPNQCRGTSATLNSETGQWELNCLGDCPIGYNMCIKRPDPAQPETVRCVCYEFSTRSELEAADVDCDMRITYSTPYQYISCELVDCPAPMCLDVWDEVAQAFACVCPN